MNQLQGSMKSLLIWMTILLMALTVLLYMIQRLSKSIRQWHRHMKYSKSTLADIDKLSGVEFEEYLQVYFEQKGYKVQLTKKSNDYGADLIMTKHGERTVVQAKRYSGSVGVAAVQEVLGAKAYYKAKYAMVVTNRYFTKQAKQLAKRSGVKLWNRDDLLNIKRVKEQPNALTETQKEGSKE